MPREIQKQNLFPYKLNEILNNDDASRFISWGQQHKSIEISDLKGFEQNVLPFYFRHGRFQSFVRQMNLYGFKKYRNSKVQIFTHDEINSQKDLIQLKSRSQKERQLILEKLQTENHIELKKEHQNDMKMESMAGSLVENKSTINLTETNEQSFSQGNLYRIQNPISNYTFPLLNSYYFVGWNQNYPQMTCSSMNHFEYFNN